MNTDEVKLKINKQPDFINLKRFDYSLAKFLERYPEGGANNKILGQALGVDETEVDVLYDQIVLKLRTSMKVT